MTEKDVMNYVKNLENGVIKQLEKRVKELEQEVAFLSKDVDKIVGRDIAA